MNVCTTYDEKRKQLKDSIIQCIELGMELQDETIWGYDDMKEDYVDDIMDIILFLQKAKRHI